MAYAIEGFSSLSQKYLSQRIASQGYAKSALLYALAGFSGGSDLLSIGRPNDGVLFSGEGDITLAQKQDLTGKLSYAPRIQGFKTSNTQVTGANSTMPTVQNPSTQSHSQAAQYMANFNFCMYLDTPIRVRQIDLDLAAERDTNGEGLTTGAVIENATKVAMEEHIDQIGSRLLYGAPSNQFIIPNDDIQGVIPAGTSTNVYGQVDRNSLSSGDPWLPINVSTAKAMDIYQLVQDVNITQKMGVYGGGANLCLLGGANYIIAKNQILARSKDAGIVQSKAGMGLPSMAKMGVEREVLRADNCYVMHEPFLDVCYGTQYHSSSALYTARPTYAIFLNLKLWKYAHNRSYNAKVTPYVDLFDKAEGAPNVKQAFIRTAAVLACDRPSVGVALYTGIAN